MLNSGREHSQTVRQFIDEVWNCGDSNAIGKYVAATFDDRAYDPPNAEGHRSMVEKLKTILPDATWTIESMTTGVDEVVVELTLRGTHRAAFRGVEARGNLVEVRCYRTFVFRDGLMVQHRALLDTQRLLQQMADQQAA